MTIEQAEALDLICHYAKEYLKDDNVMPQSIVDISKDIIVKAFKENERILSIIRKHLSIVEPITDKTSPQTILVFDIDLWDMGSQKEDFAAVKEWLDNPWHCNDKK